MKNIFASTLFLLSVTTSAWGHGYVSNMVIGGKSYSGPTPFSNAKTATPIRKITTVNPITNVNSGDMTCGIGATTGTTSIVAPATAGSQITFTWKSGTGNWGHSVGPIMTYMAKCDGPCASFNPQNAQFFKISETGRKPNSISWYLEDIKAGQSYTTTIPKNIPNGDYIIRHEIIALHFATKMNGAQFYPSCSQVSITGGSTFTSLSAATTAHGVTFPGGYKATDPGVYIPNVYTSKAYTFPGPQVAAFGTSGSRTNVTTSSSSSSPSPSATKMNACPLSRSPATSSSATMTKSANHAIAVSSTVTHQSNSTPPPSPTSPSCSASGRVLPVPYGPQRRSRLAYCAHARRAGAFRNAELELMSE